MNSVHPKPRHLSTRELQQLRSMFEATGDELDEWIKKLDAAKRTGKPRFLVWLSSISLDEAASYVRPKPATPTLATAIEALAAAADVARSASGCSIDWTREPLTEREAKIRAALLAPIISEFYRKFEYEQPWCWSSFDVKCALHRIRVPHALGLSYRSDHLASDVRAVWIELSTAADAQKRADDETAYRETLSAAIAAVDEGTS